MTPEMVVVAALGFFSLLIACLFGWRLVLPLAALVLGALVLILPNGALLIGGGVAVSLVLGTLYLLGKSGALGGASISVDCGDGDGDRSVTINYTR